MEGDPSLCRASVSLKTMLKSIRGMGYEFLVELRNLEDHGEQAPTTTSTPVEQLLAKYESVF